MIAMGSWSSSPPPSPPSLSASALFGSAVHLVPGVRHAGVGTRAEHTAGRPTTVDRYIYGGERPPRAVVFRLPSRLPVLYAVL